MIATQEWNYQAALKTLGVGEEVFSQAAIVAAIFGQPRDAYTRPGNPPKIAIAPWATGDVSVAAHELAHIVLGHVKLDKEKLSASRILSLELLAEHTAEIVCGMLSKPYDGSKSLYVEQATPAAKRYVATHETQAQAAAKRIVAAGLGGRQ